MKKVVFIFSICAVIISCKKNLKEQNHDCPQRQHWDEAQQKCVDDSIVSVDTTSNLLSDTTILVDPLAVLSSSETEVIINSTNFSKQPTVGCILIAPPCANAEYGFMRKVTSITGPKNQLVCETEFCGLDEAFKQLNFDYTSVALFSSAYDVTIASHAGDASPSTGNGISGLDSTISVSVNFSHKSLVPGLTLNGTLKLNILSVRYKYVRKRNSISPEDVLMKVDYNTTGSNLEIIDTLFNPISLAADTIKTFNLPAFRVPIPIPTPVGIIVIPYPFTETIYITILPLTITAKMKLQIAPSFHGTIGCEYSNGSWKNISNISKDTINTSDPCKKDFFFSGAITSDLTLFNPRFVIAPMGVKSLNTYFEIPHKLSLNIQTITPNYSFKFRVDANVGVELPKFWGISTKFQATAKLIDTIIAKGDWGTCGDTLSLTTGSVSSITQTSAISGGDILSDGGSTITARGVCWSTTQNPTIADSKTSDGTGTGSFTSSIIGLTPDTEYHVRAYATNTSGTAYGNDVSFTTLNLDSCDLTFTWGPPPNLQVLRESHVLMPSNIWQYLTDNETFVLCSPQVEETLPVGIHFKMKRGDSATITMMWLTTTGPDWCLFFTGPADTTNVTQTFYCQ